MSDDGRTPEETAHLEDREEGGDDEVGLLHIILFKRSVLHSDPGFCIKLISNNLLI